MRQLASSCLVLLLTACPSGQPPEPGGDEGYCGSVADWPSDWRALEAEVLRLTNEARAVGHNCDTEGVFGAAPPLAGNTVLRCAARNQSRDMQVREFFDHVNPDGDDPSDRADQAGYSWSLVGENIAAGYPTPEDVVAGWLDSDGHCRNIMDPDFDELGVGYYREPADTYEHYWTQAFGTPF